MSTPFNLHSRTRALVSSALFPAISAGVIIGIIEVVLSISFAALIFDGTLSAYVSQGIGIALLGAVINGAVIALFSSAPGVVSGNQDIPTAIVAVAAVAIAASAPGAGSERALFITVVAFLGLTTMFTGLLFAFLAQARLANLIRFLPYPVVGGFLAATGWVLLLGGIEIAAGEMPTLATFGRFFIPSSLMRWLPALALAILFLIGLKRLKHVFALPALIFTSIGVFYGIMSLSGQSIASLSATGWLLGPFPQGQLWQPLALSDLALIHWPSLLGQSASAATLAFISTLALLLNCSGLEVALNRDMSLNRELRAAGVANILAGTVGGLVGFHQLSLSVMNSRAGGGSRLGGLVAAAVALVILFSGASVLSLFPRVVLGSLVAFLGISFLLDTLAANWSRLPVADYLVIVLILLVAATVGFMEAVAVGLLVAVVLFVVNYSRIDIVRSELDGRSAQSRVTRSPEKCRMLDETADELLVLGLQGFIFFGTADSLLARIRQRLEELEPSGPRFLLLDFTHVTGVDATALIYFARLADLAKQRQLELVLTQPAPELHSVFQELQTKDAPIHIFGDMDRGLEWVEEQRLAAASSATLDHDTLQQELTSRLQDPNLALDLLAYFERQEVAKGHVLMHQHDPPDHLYLLESGKVSAYLQEEDGSVVRLQTMQDWNVLGEIGFFLGTPRTASVVVEARGVVYCLSRQTFELMQEENAQLAASLQNLILQLLAERVVHLVSVVDALRR